MDPTTTTHRIGAGDAASDRAAAVSAGNAAASALQADSNYCNTVCVSGSSTNTAVHNFKVAWNQFQKSQSVPTTLPYNGQYDQSTQAALVSLGIVAPSFCTTTCSSGSTGSTTGGQPDVGGTTPLATTGGMPTWLKWLLGLVAVAGLSYFGYVLWKRHEDGGNVFLLATEPKRKRRGKRRGKR